MPNHEAKQLRPQNVAQDGNRKEEDVKNYIENENNDGEVVQPGPIVGEVVQEHRDNSTAHVHAEPSR